MSPRQVGGACSEGVTGGQGGGVPTINSFSIFVSASFVKRPSFCRHVVLDLS